MNYRRRFPILVAIAAAITLASASPGIAATSVSSPPVPFESIAESNEARVLGSTPRDLLANAEPARSAWSVVISSEDEGRAVSGVNGYEVTCEGNIQYPHFSDGAGGAIYKTDITCTGHGLAQVTVRVRGLLSFALTDTSPISARAESDYPQVVNVNGDKKTFYTPKDGNGGRGTGYWIATSTIQIVSPGLSDVSTGTVVVKKAI